MSRHLPAYDLIKKHLVDARLNRGLTQRDLAKRLKTSQSFVARYETGERRLDIVEFIRIADALGLDVADVVREIRRTGRRRH